MVDSWVSRDPAQYKGTDVEYDRKLLRFLIDALLLRLPAVFPMPAGVESVPAGVYQHSVVGRAYPRTLPSPLTTARPVPRKVSFAGSQVAQTRVSRCRVAT